LFFFIHLYLFSLSFVYYKMLVNAFTTLLLAAAARATIVITSPTAGTQWLVNSTQTVTWTVSTVHLNRWDPDPDPPPLRPLPFAMLCYTTLGHTLT
jgi:hypothetical protein